MIGRGSAALFAETERIQFFRARFLDRWREQKDFRVFLINAGEEDTEHQDSVWPQPAVVLKIEHKRKKKGFGLCLQVVGAGEHLKIEDPGIVALLCIIARSSADELSLKN